MRNRTPSKIVKLGLCTRCGYCIAACPKGIVHLDQNLFPTISKEDEPHCTGCALCSLGCSADVDFLSLYNTIFGIDPQPLNVSGVVLKSYVGYSTNSRIRSHGSSGGVVTGLLVYMLRTHRIEQALVCTMKKDDPCKPVPIMAQTIDEIIDSAQSKYTIVPQMMLANSIKPSQKTTAVVGLPCHIHSLRKLELVQPGLSEKIPLIIGLACHSTLEIEATDKLLQLSQLHREDIRKLEYRGGDKWPGGIQATLHSGKTKKLHNLNIKSAFNRLTWFYTPQRCLTCIDHTAEFSDISVMDPWIRNKKGEYPYENGFSLILARTDRALKILDQAAADGDLIMEEIPRSILSQHFSFMARKKKVGASIRIENLKNRGRAFPVYNLDFPSATLMNNLREYVYSLAQKAGRAKCVRNMGMRFCFSAFGDMLMTAKSQAGKKICKYNK